MLGSHNITEHNTSVSLCHQV